MRPHSAAAAAAVAGMAFRALSSSQPVLLVGAGSLGKALTFSINSSHTGGSRLLNELGTVTGNRMRVVGLFDDGACIPGHGGLRQF